MKWFVYQQSLESGKVKLYYVNARTEKAALKRLQTWRKRFKLMDGAIMLMRTKPYDLLIEVWQEYGMNGTMVAPE